MPTSNSKKELVYFPKNYSIMKQFGNKQNKSSTQKPNPSKDNSSEKEPQKDLPKTNENADLPSFKEAVSFQGTGNKPTEIRHHSSSSKKEKSKTDEKNEEMHSFHQSQETSSLSKEFMKNAETIIHLGIQLSMKERVIVDEDYLSVLLNRSAEEIQEKKTAMKQEFQVKI